MKETFSLTDQDMFRVNIFTRCYAQCWLLYCENEKKIVGFVFIFLWVTLHDIYNVITMISKSFNMKKGSIIPLDISVYYIRNTQKKYYFYTKSYALSLVFIGSDLSKCTHISIFRYKSWKKISLHNKMHKL